MICSHLDIECPNREKGGGGLLKDECLLRNPWECPFEPKPDGELCPDCHGDGRIQKFFDRCFSNRCPTCNGYGRLEPKPDAVVGEEAVEFNKVTEELQREAMKPKGMREIKPDEGLFHEIREILREVNSIRNFGAGTAYNKYVDQILSKVSLHYQNYVEEAVSKEHKSMMSSMVDEGNDAYKRGVVSERERIIPLFERLLLIAGNGDYSNGVEAFGVDEGRVRAHEALDEIEKEWEALKLVG